MPVVKLSPKVNTEIEAVIHGALHSGAVIRAYLEAEKIRQANIADNVALEDILDAIIAGAAGGPHCEADPADARAAVLGYDLAPAETSHE
jgi:hypothetical protein